MAGANWPYFDHLVQSFSSAYVYADRLPVLEDELAKSCLRLSNQEPTIDDFENFIAPQSLIDRVSRKLAWTCQHALNARAWCVGQKIINTRGDSVFSPLVRQIERLGVPPVVGDLTSFADWRTLARVRPKGKLDAMLVSLGSRTIYLVNGCSYSQAKKRARNLKLGESRKSLFGEERRYLTGVVADPRAVASLLLARAIVEASFEGFSVVPAYIVVDDPDCGWNYQAFDLRTLRGERVSSDDFDLDDFPVLRSSIDDQAVFDADSDSFARLPRWGGEDPLECSPLDRTTRVIMILDALWRHQSGDNGALRFIPATQLATEVQDQRRLEYPVDLRRHDLEDSLHGNPLIQRRKSGENDYALTPTGFARLFMIRRQFNQSKNVNNNIMVLDHIKRLARLWHEHETRVFSVSGLELR